MNEVNILGTRYTIEFLSDKDDERLLDIDGYTDFYSKIIVVNNDMAKSNLHDFCRYCRKVLRHEIVHAYLYESGLAHNSNYCESWAVNEEMIDFIAIQGEKIYKTWEELNTLD